MQMSWGVRGIRGAITVEENTRDKILQASRELVDRMLELNQVDPADIASIIFSVTEDLDAVFPAQALREPAFRHVPLLDCREIPVPGSLKKCIRVLMHVNTGKTQKEMVHAYLGSARALREDLVQP
jgi:chorismate mutase